MEACRLSDKTPQIPIDPNLALEEARAQTDLVGGLTAQSQGDMASLMARYGTQLAMAGAQTGPLVSTQTGALSGARAA